MGYIQSKRGDWKAAAESYSTAARIEPSAQQFRNLACAYNNLERYGEALGAYNAAIRAEPKDAEAFYGLGWVHDKLGHEKDSASAYLRAAELSPQYANSSGSVAWAYALRNTKKRFRHTRKQSKLVLKIPISFMG